MAPGDLTGSADFLNHSQAMRIKALLVFSIFLIPQISFALTCEDLFAGKPVRPPKGFVPDIRTITREELHRRPQVGRSRSKRPFIDETYARALVEAAKQPHLPGQYGPRLITDEVGETPDIDKPVRVTLPDGKQAWFFGLSGQQYLLVDSIDQLARGGTVRPRKIEMLNENGFPYGQDYDPRTGKKIPYALDSSTWDASAVQAFDQNGRPTLKLLAGALANGPDGKPLLIRQKNAAQSRRRVVFHDVQWKKDAAGEWTLSARQPKSPFFNTDMRDGTWSRFDADGKPIFIHSYGGGPVKLANGETYPDTDGNLHWAGDGVFEVRKVIGAKRGEWKYTPYHSGMYMAKLDPTLTTVVEPPHVVLDGFKEDGSVYAEAHRPGIGPLVEGGHIEPRVVLENGKTRPIMSLADLKDIRARGLQEYMIMVGSTGRYDRNYGTFEAIAAPGSTDFKMVIRKNGKLYDLAGAFQVLLYAAGRPVVVVGESGQSYVLLHGDERLDFDSNLKHLSRQIWMAPVETKTIGGVEYYEILDNTGLLDALRNYQPRPLPEPSAK